MISLPPMASKQLHAWKALLEVAEQIPDGWTLVGGQLVHLHVCERGGVVSRATNDGDVVLDVRARGHILYDFTKVLKDCGFAADTSPDGLQHRWMRGATQIDVLIPRYLGERASQRKTVSGRPTIESPASQQALSRSEKVQISLPNGVVGEISRPNILGALVGKAAAFQDIQVQRAAERHLEDFGIMAGLVDASDHAIFQGMNTKDLSRVTTAAGEIRNRPHLKIQFDANLNQLMSTVNGSTPLRLPTQILAKTPSMVNIKQLCGIPVRGTTKPCVLRPLHRGYHSSTK